MNRQQRRHVSRRYPLCHAMPAAVTPCAPRWSHWRGAWCPNGLRGLEMPPRLPSAREAAR